MKLRNLLLDLSKDDILKLISIQDKTIIKSLELEDLIKVSGSYKLMGMNIDFNGTMSINSFKNNIIFIRKRRNLNRDIKGKNEFMCNGI